MTNVESQSSKKTTSLFADLILLAGLGLACWGVFKFSIGAGLIAAGIILIILARSVAPQKK